MMTNFIFIKYYFLILNYKINESFFYKHKKKTTILIN